jgi:ABC-type sugar transport system permease subunit
MRGSTSAAYILPSVALLGALLISPVVYALWFSLHRVEYGAATDFVGLANYAMLLDDPHLAPMLGRTALFTVASVALAVTAALALACWIDGLRGRLAFIVQLVAILPWIISAVVATLLFRWVFVHDSGLGFAAARALGLHPTQPLNTPTGAMSLLILVSAWKRIGYAVIVLLAGLKSIPGDLTEAARIDGAGPWQIFRQITLPLLRGPMILVIIVLTLSNLNTVETPLVLTGGGPAGATTVLPLAIYNRAFVDFDIGGATTLALAAFALNLVLVLGYVRLARLHV